MNRRIAKNYFYNDEKKSLYRIITNPKHLFWKPEWRGLVAFNSHIYNEYKNIIQVIGWVDRTNKNKEVMYYMSSDDFDKHKKEIQYAEPQYLVAPLLAWESIKK